MYSEFHNVIRLSSNDQIIDECHVTILSSTLLPSLNSLSMEGADRDCSKPKLTNFEQNSNVHHRLDRLKSHIALLSITFSRDKD